jgi:hypothetical protein
LNKGVFIATKEKNLIVHRMTFYIKAGQTDEALALALAEIKRYNWHRPIRFYATKTERFNTLASESEFANLAEYEQFWNDWFADPAARAFLDKWTPLEEPGGMQKLWELVE